MDRTYTASVFSSLQFLLGNNVEFNVFTNPVINEQNTSQCEPHNKKKKNQEDDKITKKTWKLRSV